MAELSLYAQHEAWAAVWRRVRFNRFNSGVVSRAVNETLAASGWAQRAEEGTQAPEFERARAWAEQTIRIYRTSKQSGDVEQTPAVLSDYVRALEAHVDARADHSTALWDVIMAIDTEIKIGLKRDWQDWQRLNPHSLAGVVAAAREAYDKQASNYTADQAFVLAAEFQHAKQHAAGRLQAEKAAKAALVVPWEALDTVRRETRKMDSASEVYKTARRKYHADRFRAIQRNLGCLSSGKK